MSNACRESLLRLFGTKIYEKARVHYPHIPQAVIEIGSTSSTHCRFLFVGSQFEIKGGEALLKAFRRVYARLGRSRLDVVTHLPPEFEDVVGECEGVHIHEFGFARTEIWAKFMKQSDVLVLPTYVDSFGMVVLEALAHGLGLIATDVYALGEMVRDGHNGNLIRPPLSIWDGVMPSKYYYDLKNIKKRIRQTDTKGFELELERALERFIVDTKWRLKARQASIELMKERFAC